MSRYRKPPLLSPGAYWLIKVKKWGLLMGGGYYRVELINGGLLAFSQKFRYLSTILTFFLPVYDPKSQFSVFFMCVDVRKEQILSYLKVFESYMPMWAIFLTKL